MKTTTRPAAKKTARKTTKPRSANRGNLTKAEMKPLVLAAREAYDVQTAHGNTDGESFDVWRRAQVQGAVGKGGLSECYHADWRPLMAHFKTLAGRDAEGFEMQMRTGKPLGKGAPGDTIEAREKIVHEIRTRLAEHVQLADTRWFDLLVYWEGKSRQEHEIYQREAGQELAWPGLSNSWLNKQMAAKATIEEKGGPLREGYVAAVIKRKTRRPDLNLGRDIWAGLAERCTVKQLSDLLSTMVNRINAREGRGERANRNKSQRRPARKGKEEA